MFGVFEFRPSPFISKVEEDFLAFCRAKNLECVLNETGPDGTRYYKVILSQEFLDETERKIVKHCKEENIKYTFYRDEDGNHHYEFSRMIDAFPGAECYVNLPSPQISYDAILTKYENARAVELEPEKIPPKKWWEKLLNRLGFCRVVKKPVTKEKTADELFMETLGLERETLLRLGLPYDDFDTEYREDD